MSSYSDNSDSAASATPVSGGRNVADLKIDVLRLVGPCCSSLQSGDFSFFFLTPPLVTPRLSSSPRPLPPSPSSAHRQLTDAENPCTVDEGIAALQLLDSEVKRKTIVEWLCNWKTGALQFLVDIREEQNIKERHSRESAARLGEAGGLLLLGEAAAVFSSARRPAFGCRRETGGCRSSSCEAILRSSCV